MLRGKSEWSLGLRGGTDRFDCISSVHLLDRLLNCLVLHLSLVFLLQSLFYVTGHGEDLRTYVQLLLLIFHHALEFPIMLAFTLLESLPEVLELL